jgi:hypothetical protein
MTTALAENLQPNGQELLVPDYRTAELGTPAHFVGLQARWEQMRVHSYPEIGNETDAEAFANSRRHTGDFLCAPETVDALLLLAQNDPALEPGHPAADAITALNDMMGTVDTYRQKRNLQDADDATVLAHMRTQFYRGDMSYAQYTVAYNAIREQGTAYLATRITDIAEDETITRYDGGKQVTQLLREVATRASKEHKPLFCH